MDMTGRLTHGEYHTLDSAIKQVMRRSAGDAVMLGYLLRRMMDEKLWASQYSSLDAYLREELHMDYTMACRFEAINQKYSVGGHSKDIDAKWEGYSQGVLIEMLNMPPELEEKVTPDMTVRQVREVKRQAREKKVKERAAEDGRKESVSDALTEIREKGSMGNKAEPDGGEGGFPGKDEVPDAEYSEVEAVDEVATSQHIGQEETEGGEAEAEQDGGVSDGLTEVRHILEKEQKMLDGFQEAMEEDAEAGPEPEERNQPPLPSMKNNDQRREWLKSYKDWGLWYRDENIGVEYYKYDFDNGARLIAEVYQEPKTKYCDAYESCFLHLVGGPKPQENKNGIGKWQRHERYSRYPNSETELVEFLKEVQRNG